MRKYLWSLAFALIALAVIIFLLPGMMGFVVESKYQKIAATINSNTPLKIEIIDYQRGWFSANATARISLDLFEQEDQDLRQCIITAHILHGPIIVNLERLHFAIGIINAEFNLNEIQNTLLKRADDAGPIAVSNIKIKLNAATDLAFESPPLSYQDTENSFQWKGLKINAEFSQMFNQAQLAVDFPGINIDIKNYIFHLSGANGSYKGNKISDGLWSGERNLRINSFSTKRGGGSALVFNDVNLHFLIDDHEDIINAVVDIALDGLNIGNDSYNKSKLDLEINNVNKAAFIKMRQQLVSDKDSLGSDFDAIISLLSSGGEVNIKQFDTASPWGKLLATIKIIVAKQPKNKGILTAIASSIVTSDIKIERSFALHLIEKFYEKIQFQKQTRESLSNQAESLLNEWQQSGKITNPDKGPYLHVVFDYKDGKSLLNGKALILTTKT
jgi:uncharacterized protein YdgA (DUF945 family)